MRSYLSLLLVLVAVRCKAQEGSNGLESYVGRDLRKLDEAAAGAFSKRFEALTGEKLKQGDDSDPFESWWVKEFRAGAARWMFLEAYPGYDVPDVSAVRAHIFDANWKRIAKQSFPTGYRFFLKEAKIVTDKSLGQDLLEAQALSSGPFIVRGDEKKPAFEQGDYQLQYYGLFGKELAMLRLEDNEGHPVRNDYRWRAPPKGPAAPKRTKDEWIECLASENVVELLAALVWLSGSHLPSAEPRREAVNQESVEDSRLFEAVRDSPRTKEIIGELTKSKQPWIRSYADLLVRGSDTDN